MRVSYITVIDIEKKIQLEFFFGASVGNLREIITINFPFSKRRKFVKE